MEKTGELEQILAGWIRWYRIHRAVTWAVRGVSLGLSASILAAFPLILSQTLSRRDFFWLVFLLTAVCLLLCAGAMLLWRMPRLEMARRFDRWFGLQERVSTALEAALLPSSSPIELDLRAWQQADALLHARKIIACRRLPISLARADRWLPVLLASLLACLYIGGASSFDAVNSKEQVSQVISNQADQIEILQNQVEQSPAFSSNQKQTITNTLEQTVQALHQAQTLEQAAASLARAQQQIDSQVSTPLSNQADLLAKAGSQLVNSKAASLQPFGQALASNELPKASQALQSIDIPPNGSAAQQALAAQLETAAQLLEKISPELAAQLTAAAQSLHQGDTAGAQEHVLNAAQVLETLNAQTEAVAQAAEQVKQAQRQVLQASADSAAAGSPGQAGSTALTETQSSGAGGSGSGSAGTPSSPGNEAAAYPVEQNDAGNSGQPAYQQIYSPVHLGGSEGTVVVLPSSGVPGEQVIGQGDKNTALQLPSQVPYNQVFPFYKELYSQAAARGEIPLSLQPIVRDYFDAIKP